MKWGDWRRNRPRTKSPYRPLQSLEDASKSMVDLAKHVQRFATRSLVNNTKMVDAVKKTLPKLKDSVIAELQGKIGPLETGLTEIKGALETERKALPRLKAPRSFPGSRASARCQQGKGETEGDPNSYQADKRTGGDIGFPEILSTGNGSKVHALEAKLKQAME